MPNIANVLKEEIARLARKELRSETDGLKKAVTGYRHEIATLKRRMQQMETQLKSANKKVAKLNGAAGAAASDEGEQRQLRFSPARFASQRKKLGLSAAQFAQILGVSSLSVYKWEHGQARPRRAQLEAIAASRKLGKREALAKLEELSQAAPAKASSKPTAKRAARKPKEAAAKPRATRKSTRQAAAAA